MSANDRDTAEALCAQWMPRKKTTCARTPGHAGPCITAENMARRRAYRRSHPHPESSDLRATAQLIGRSSQVGTSAYGPPAYKRGVTGSNPVALVGRGWRRAHWPGPG